MTVTIYSTPSCHFCHMAKEYFVANNVAFTDIDVAANSEKRAEMVDLSGQMGVPVIRIQNDASDDVIVGFNQALLASKLGIAA